MESPAITAEAIAEQQEVSGACRLSFSASSRRTLSVDTPKKPPHWQGTEAEWRRKRAEALFEVETTMREEGMGDPALIFDEAAQVFRFAYDGVFAFSREHADWPELKRRGLLEG